MAISTSFSGASILKPGAYSQTNVQIPGGFPLTTTGTLLLVGEAAGGQPNVYNSFTSEEFGSLLATYLSGPLVDAALAALNPAIPSANSSVGGFNTVILYKTNQSVQASLQLKNASAAEVLLLTDANWGVQGNYKQVQVQSGSLPNTVLVSVQNTVTNVTENLPQNAAAPQLSIVYSGTGTAATLAIAGASDSAKTLTTSVTGATGDDLNLALNQYTMSQLVNAINANGKYVAVLLNGQTGSITPATDLDPVTALNIVEGTVVLSTTGDTTTGSNQLTALASTSGIVAGQIITGTGIPNGTTVVSITGSVVTMSANATATGSAVSVAFSDVPELYRLQHEIVDIINQNSQQVVAAVAGINPGLPANIPYTLMSGGLAGASADSNFNSGFVNSLSMDYDVVVPCVSQDAAPGTGALATPGTDIALGLTDSGSTYKVASVQADLRSALINRWNVKNRKEAQAVVGFRTNAKAQAYSAAETLNYYPMQLVMQDVYISDQNGNLVWKQPHVMAAMLGGMRCGVDIGTPLTHKYLNIIGLGMYVNPANGVDGSDFNPLTDFDPAIQAGVTFAEPSNGVFRIVVDNTTYGLDANFVFNRGSVIQAAVYIVKTLRSQLESLFVGQKVSTGIDQSILNTIRGIMSQLYAAQIITGTNSLPLGWDPNGTVVNINGNVASISIPVVPVQGLDFILLTVNLNNIVQSA